MNTLIPLSNRRPLRSRGAGWAQGLARLLCRSRLSPNGISLLGLGFSLAGFAFLALSASLVASPFFLLAAAATIQLRLLCNLMDGLVAIEGGRRSSTGDLYNEAPDRLEDVLFLVGAGIAAAASQPWALILGFFAAIAAVGTAYIRVFGVSLGQPQNFCGPMAKPQRMFFLTIGCLGTFVERLMGAPDRILPLMLAIILAGSFLTIVRRLRRLTLQLKEQS